MEDEWDDELLSKIDDLESLHLRAAAERQAQQHQQQTHGGGAFVPTASPAQWACNSCTLLNASWRTTCQVCTTPRGHTLGPAAATTKATPPQLLGASANDNAEQLNRLPSRVLPKKTVQATLPFAAPVRPAGPPSAQPVPAPPAAFWQPQRQTQLPPPLNPARQAVAAAIDNDGDDIEDPEAVRAFNQTVWPIAHAALQHRPGEDAEAKTRYLDVLNRSGFPAIDYEAAQQFVYPTNYPIRDYQLTISEKALYHNTMVSLPTGLGKTLIASVVMYNFYRWFPQGKIVFMAPTKPLVAQQIKACHEIMGIPLADTAELQGNVPPSTRKVLWKEKRVFFCTPQSMQNDLRHGICEAERFVCVVIDEAHRATGNYAYCLVVQEIEKKTQFFRVLALSATPGAKFDIIQDVIKNLRISHIESRSADDPDVKKYTHARQEEVIKCTLSSQITEMKSLFLKVFERIVHRLVSGNIIQHRDPEKLSRWYVLQMRERFRQSPTYSANRAAESDLALLVSLLHAKDLLTVHGLSSFQEYVNGWIEERETGARLSWSKKEMMQSTEFHSLVLGLNALGHGTLGKSSSNGKSSSHPKLLKLREVLHEHFQRHSTGNSSTRAIVFTQYRSSVTEIVGLLDQMAPLLKVQAFVGQGASGKAKESKGQSQKQQQEIVKKFRNGEFNVLVATCIAEEGLDIGEVDLIVSFDALTSPVRMIQRMGRTGRKRVGKVIILVTEGDEEKKLARSVASAKTVSRAMTTFKSKFVYSKCPRMIPNGIQPELSKLEMLIPEFHSSQIGGKQRLAGHSGRQRQENSEESSRRRWQLNEIEKAIGNARYFPPDFRSRPRNAIFPVLSRPRHLLRRRRVLLRGNERVESDTFQVGHSRRSAVLRCLVKKIHGADDSDEEVIEGNGSEARSQSSDATPILVPASSVSRTNVQERARQSLESGAQNDIDVHAVNDFSLSAVEEGGGSGRTADDTFGSQDIHFFSPGWNESTPVEMGKEKVETRNAKPPVERSAAAATNEPHEPKSSVEKPATPLDQPQEATVDASRKKSSQIPSSPVQPQLASPPQTKASKPEKVKRNSSETSSKKESRVESKEFERGEQLLQRLRDLVVESTTAASNLSVTSPEPEVRKPEEAGSQSAKLPQAPLSFPRLRITRRLDFEAVEASRPLASKENCVPEPPSTTLEIPKLVLPEAPKPLTPELTPEEPVFDLLPTPTFSLLQENVVVDEPANKPRRSLALKHVHPAADREESTPRVESAMQNSVPSAPVDPGIPTPRIHHAFESVVPSIVAREQTITEIEDGDEPPSSAKEKPTILDIEDFDEPDDALNDVHGRAPTRAVSEEVPASERHSSASQKRVHDSSGHLATQNDSCAVCTEVESFEDDPIVYCDGCDLGVHQFCYGIASLPSGKWFCDSCIDSALHRNTIGKASCYLCPLRGGAVKRTLCGHWAHVQCFMWLPELRLVQDRDVLTLGSLKNLDPDRNTLDCSLCHSRKGRGVVQCAYKRCMVAFHVSCASYAHYKLVQEEQAKADGGETLFLAYCQLHGRRRESPGAQQTNSKSAQVQAQQTPPKVPASGNKAASPSALLFSPTDHGSAQKFRKFRRLKRKYDATQSPSESADRRSSWGKRMKRSQKYTEGRKKQSAAMARMFIEDDVEVHGEDDEDDDDDMEEEEADELDDSFINDSSQLLYSPESTPGSAGKGKASDKRKRFSPGDMRAVYARSLVESQDLPAFMRRGQRDFGALPAHGIINACLQELNNPQSPLPQQSSARESMQESPISLLSPAAQVHDGGRFARTQTTPPSTSKLSTRLWDEASARSNREAALSEEPRLRSAQSVHIESEPLDRSMDGDGDDVGSNEVAPPSFSLLPTVARSVVSAPEQPQVERPGVGAVKKPPVDEDRSVQDRIETNRLKALEKLRERQMKLAQIGTPNLSRGAAAETNRNLSLKPQQETIVNAAHAISSANQGPPPPSRLPNGTSSHTAAIFSDANVVPEPPSFSLFPSSIAAETNEELSRIELTEDSKRGKPQLMPQVLVVVNSSFSQSAMFPALIAKRTPDCAVEIENSLEADLLLSARLAVMWMTSQQCIALERQSPEKDILKHPRFQSCSSIFKKVMIAIQVDSRDAVSLTRIAGIQRLGDNRSVEIVMRPSHEELSQHLLNIAQSVSAFHVWNGNSINRANSMCVCVPFRNEKESGFSLAPAVPRVTAGAIDSKFMLRLAYFRSIPFLSYGSSLSLSFRFQNFAVAQVPVKKFNQMHWRRMLPWITDANAKQIQDYILSHTT